MKVFLYYKKNYCRKPVEQFLKAVDELQLKDITEFTSKMISKPLKMGCFGEHLTYFLLHPQNLSGKTGSVIPFYAVTTCLHGSGSVKNKNDISEKLTLTARTAIYYRDGLFSRLRDVIWPEDIE
ncbi:hypothetical protein YC2023_093640 [Brassica napus]